MTAVEYVVDAIKTLTGVNIADDEPVIEKAKEMEKQNTDNKVIHFAEWLTKKHTCTLMALYEQFEEEFYNEEL
jgi:hypothetical protein